MASTYAEYAFTFFEWTGYFLHEVFDLIVSNPAVQYDDAERRQISARKRQLFFRKLRRHLQLAPRCAKRVGAPETVTVLNGVTGETQSTEKVKQLEEELANLRLQIGQFLGGNLSTSPNPVQEAHSSAAALPPPPPPPGPAPSFKEVSTPIVKRNSKAKIHDEVQTVQPRPVPVSAPLSRTSSLTLEAILSRKGTLKKIERNDSLKSVHKNTNSQADILANAIKNKFKNAKSVSIEAVNVDGEEDGEESFTEENFEVPSPVKSKNNVGEFTLEKENYSGNLRKSTSGKRAGAPPPLPPRKPSTLVAGLSPMPLSTID